MNETLDFAAMGSGIGRQIMGAMDAKENGYTKMAQALADTQLKNAQGSYYQQKADSERQRAQYQTPEYGTRMAAAAAGLTDPQAGEMGDYIKNGNWGMTPAREDDVQQMTIAPTPKAQPAWATPEATAKYNATRAAHLMNLGATGNTNADQLAKAVGELQGQGRIDNALQTGGNAGLNAYQAANDGRLYSSTPRGILSQENGNEAVNTDWANTQRAQAANSYASAGQHNASAAKARAEMAPPTPGELAAPEGFSPGAIDNAAARYNMDGTLPPMGMGKEGALGRRAILNRAAEIAAASGVTPEDARIAQLGNKANSAALSKLQQQQTMVGAFEKNFNANADIALELSQGVDRTGVPLANKWINAGKRNIGGDPKLAAFDQAIKSVSNEYAKIISGSMGNTATAQSEIKTMEEKLNSAQTPEQVQAVIALMKRETQNRMTAFEEEKTQLRSTMHGGKQTAPVEKPKSEPIDRVQLLSEAKDAIARGAPRAEVIKQLRAMGIKDGAI